MAAEIPWEIRERAEELYIVDGLTYEQTARETGVSDSQLKRWGVRGQWNEKRKEYREALGEIKRDTVKLRRNLLREALTSLDPQAVYAVARLEQVAAQAAKGEPSPARPAAIEREVETPAQAAEAIREAVEQRINRMLSGDMDLKGLKDLKAALELWEKLDAANRPEAPETGRKGISDEVAEQIKREILGIRD